MEVIINFFYFKSCPNKHFYKCSYNLENKVLELHKYIKALPQNSHALCTAQSERWAEEPQTEPAGFRTKVSEFQTLVLPPPPRHSLSWEMRLLH